MRKQKADSKSSHKNRENFVQNLFGDIPELSFRGNREVIIEGSRGVVEYSENVIRINTSIGVVCFLGRNLNLVCISPTELIINGFITKVEFVL